MRNALFILICLMSGIVRSQDTFSICAFDPQTGEIGSAGATCIESSAVSAIIISDVIPGLGAVHTQSYWLAANQNYAHDLMLQGLSADDIIDSLVANDVEGDPSIRQYGVVRLDQGGQTAAYTGLNCFDYKNHILGPNYAIQGNILLGQQILDSMEARFINTEGDLACKLMAAMLGAKVIGADTRCEDNGTSSFSAFIRVANVDDDANDLNLDITVNTYSEGTEPIDSLLTLFQMSGGCNISRVDSPEKDNLVISSSDNNVRISTQEEIRLIEVMDLSGRLIYHVENTRETVHQIPKNVLQSGVLLFRIEAGGEVYSKTWLLE